MFVNIPNDLIVVFHCFSCFLFISAWLLSFSLGLYVAAVLFFSPENVKDGHIVLSHADKSVIYIVCLCLPERKSKHIFSEMPSCLLAGVHIINELSVVAAAFRCQINNMVDGRDTQMCACVCVCVWLKQNTSAHTHTHTHKLVLPLLLFLLQSHRECAHIKCSTIDTQTFLGLSLITKAPLAVQGPAHVGDICC